MAVDTAAPLPNPLAMGMVEQMVISRSGRGQFRCSSVRFTIVASGSIELVRSTSIDRSISAA